MKRLKYSIVKHFSFVLIVKGWWVAWRDHFLPIKSTYSQAGEDAVIAKLLEGCAPETCFYIDVGANHPTRLSNSYRLYRSGWRGLVVEPNAGLLAMHKRIRPQDMHLGIACGNAAGALRFQHAVSHVLSGFNEGCMKTDDFRRTELMPVLPIDLLMKTFPGKEVALLSIDVEGFDLNVAKGAVETLKRTRVVCIEGCEKNVELVEFFAQNGFRVHLSTPHNLIFVQSTHCNAT